ncbi:Dual-action HEIGH metallo-peptidase [Sinomicrobium oceani]|uniref:Dual-action HEIGH metallo-peptidase n=1 Tax=Sinomicrobium oceani TaxID=1150368 RepID=A0A1K1QFX8_9FLAO|nr:M57 family metalloprotease [Sinomicrobium oceani]SFW58612.1 Dual-action HEIGH metallo-peptidase [Sinomicrobium oceani]
MKTMKYFFISAVAGIGLLLTACQNDPKEDNIEAQQEVSQEVLDKLASLELNTHDVKLTDMILPDGSVETNYLLEGDIVMSKEHLSEMELHGGVVSEQYRTYNLVSSPRTINVIGYTGSSQGLSSAMQTALQQAIANYNNLGLGLTFTLTFGTNYTPYDIVVYSPAGGAGGQAGFPSGGNPYKFVQIFSGLNSYSIAVIRHVIMHEIGHCLGSRHTDWFSRQSCGQNVNEGEAGVGAVHIPGTPTGYDSSSVMLSCFNSGVSGNWGYYDIVALNYLY